ncbi:unnamed protein product [Closterium sp. NIES-53]
MRDLYAKLATAGITYPEQTKCLKMLSLLPESWLQFTSGLSLPQNQSLWTLEWVQTKILEEDFRRRQLRGGDDGSSGYGIQGSRCKGAEEVSKDVKFLEGMMYGGWKKQPETKVSQQMEQITMQLDLTPSVWEEGEESAAEGDDREKVQEAPAGGGDDVETSGSTKEAAGSEGGEK